ncbi:similar to cytochrome c mitochondrial import factor (Cyc2) [Plenodomus lingam JN3]|uniref:Similar to cytochrome c mitochondrial import factor (Cyc2) n=1 Tax=Leptosphaeria maculans (strain JN3 / isolate v23.1.3 / race Av1-4-5-6-7-8) TaxID=985895 RepID=E5A042_LEPMJ|nr:similar to cytochrome c mitochondrial import factor (Cyc2) [Plenodomus lingam JN3]CBX96902.1 similar to cytochrome c mitochondrial import factor (Cyc2) [Plenodomus lingam JN3]
MSRLKRYPIPLLILGTSAVAGATYRILAPPSSSSTSSLNPHTFTPYTLVDKQRVSSTSAIFTLRQQGATEPESVREAWRRGGIWSVQIKQPQLQIARAYTPLPSVGVGVQPGPDGATAVDGDAARELRLLIRQELGGEVSTYLHRLPLDAQIEVRGPHVELELPAHVREVVFLAGGTGIAPAMQIARALGARGHGCRMSVFWANRRREECVGGVGDGRGDGKTTRRWTGWFNGLGRGSGDFTQQQHQRQQGQDQISLTDRHEDQEKGDIVKELEALKSQNTSQRPFDLSLHYYVDEERTFIQPSEIARRIGQPRDEGGVGSRVIVVSGPEGFLEHWAGKKRWAGGREVQGPLGGQLGRMDLRGWEVVKL